MTTGERIAQKRKELGLSQEGLGEQMGVSRQAIYKWESDAALPEIEKLISLSRTFSVSVGWLLGVEEPAEERSAPEGSGELTEEQLKMVEEIVDRYLAARPAPTPPAKRKKWPFLLAGAVLIVVFISLFSRLSELRQQYNNLQNSIYNVTANVNTSIHSITQQVEEVLKSQNDLTASYGSEILTADLAAGTVTFRVWATPKIYTEGMTACFTADDGETVTEAEGVLRSDSKREYSADITCALTDDITLSVVFATGDKRETQVLDGYSDLYRGSFPFVNTVWPLWFSVEGNVLEEDSNRVQIYDSGKELGDIQAEVVSVRVGLFKDQKLVQWYTEVIEPTVLNGEPTVDTVYRREGDLELEPGHIYCEVVVAVDQYGRERLFLDTPIEYSGEEGWHPVDTNTDRSDPEGWEY